MPDPTASQWVLRPTYSVPRFTAPSDIQGPWAVARLPDKIFVAGGSSGNKIARFNMTGLDIDPAVFVLEQEATLGPAAGIAAMIDLPDQTHLLAVTRDSPARVLKVLGSDLTSTSLTLNAGEDSAVRIVMAGTYAYVLLATSPGKIVTIDFSGATPVRTAVHTLNAGENAPRAITWDTAHHVYVGLPSTPGAIVKLTEATGVLTRTLAATVPLASVNALEYTRGNPIEWLIAHAGAPAGTGATAFYRLRPSDLAIDTTIGVPAAPTNSRVTWMVFDDAARPGTVSPLPGRYVYATAEGIPGRLWRLDVGLQDKYGEFHINRQFNNDWADDINIDTQFAWDGATLFYPIYTNPGQVLRFLPEKLGLIVVPLINQALTWGRPARQELFSPIGADLDIARIYGRGGRTNMMLLHRVGPSADLLYHYVRHDEDEATIAACRPFSFVMDFGPYGFRRTRAMIVGDMTPLWPEGPLNPFSTIAFPLTEIAI